MEGKFRRVAARSHVVRSSEGRQEVIEGNPVRDVDGGEPKAPLVLVAAEKVVISEGKVE